jgi:DNA-binding NarL/FixJ family response regulator
VDSLERATALCGNQRPSILLIDKGIGIHLVLEWLNTLRLLPAKPPIVVWGAYIDHVETLRLLQAGANGIIRKTANVDALLACLQTVADGNSWIEDSVCRDSIRYSRYAGSGLTGREKQVLDLIQHGCLQSWEIASALGICENTVRVHVRNLFAKTGVNSRYALSISRN